MLRGQDSAVNRSPRPVVSGMVGRMTDSTSPGTVGPTPARRSRFSLRDVGRALRNPHYRIYALGNIVSLLGTWVQRVALGWLTWELTHSAAWLGVIAFADLIPSIVVGPFAGAIADRVDRKRLMIVAQLLAMAQAAALAVLTFGGWITIEWILVLTIYLGIAVGISQPVRLSLIPSLVRREDLSAATAFNSIMFNTARFIGPAIAGAVIVWGGTAPAFAINAVSYLALVAALMTIRMPPEAETRTHDRRVLAGMAEGARYAVSHPGIGPLLLLIAVVALFARPFTELLPGFASEVFGRGADGLAWLQGATGLGAMLGGMWLAQRPALTGLTRFVTVNIALFPLALLGFTATDVFPVGLAAAAVAGFAMIGGTIGTLTLIQVAVDGTMRGRVMSLYGVVFRGGMATGALTMGSLSAAFGLRETVAGGAALALCLGLWLGRRVSRMSGAIEAE